jgi:hypothetical protein
MTFIVGRRIAILVLFTLPSLQATAALDLAAASLQRMALEPNTDRPGQDYYAFDLRAANPETCRAACERDTRCRAFTYVKPGVQGRYARCYLKKAAPTKRADRCCVSGARR